MDLNIETMDNIQNDFLKSEKIFTNSVKWNKFIKLNKEFIMSVNIRGLNTIFFKLQVFIESLEVKPSVIVCTETRILEFCNFFSLKGL